MKHKLLIAIVGLIVVPSLAFFWLLQGQDIQMQWNLRVYPGSEYVSHAYSRYGADSAIRVQYYWTADNIDQVRDYYAAFVLPFIDNMTLFHPYGEALDAKNSDGTPIDFSTRRTCDYTQLYSCVQVELIDFSTSDSVYLPDKTTIGWNQSTATPLSNPLHGGTLIIYGYYGFDP